MYEQKVPPIVYWIGWTVSNISKYMLPCPAYVISIISIPRKSGGTNGDEYFMWNNHLMACAICPHIHLMRCDFIHCTYCLTDRDINYLFRCPSLSWSIIVLHLITLCIGLYHKNCAMILTLPIQSHKLYHIFVRCQSSCVNMTYLPGPIR